MNLTSMSYETINHRMKRNNLRLGDYWVYSDGSGCIWTMDGLIRFDNNKQLSNIRKETDNYINSPTK